MFKSKKEVSMAKNVDVNLVDRIAEGTIFEGNISASKGIRIDGTVKGSVTCEGRVVVGKTGVIEGQVACLTADIEGVLKSTVTVKELLELKSTANVLGEVLTGKLAVEPGAAINGTLSMGVVKDIMSNHQNQNQDSSLDEKTA